MMRSSSASPMYARAASLRWANDVASTDRSPDFGIVRIHGFAVVNFRRGPAGRGLPRRQWNNLRGFTSPPCLLLRCLRLRRGLRDDGPLFFDRLEDQRFAHV